MNLAARSSLAAAAPGDLVRWAGVFAGPVAWFAQFQVAYWLAPRACAGMGRLPLHLATLMGLLVAVGGAGVAWRTSNRAGLVGPTAPDGGSTARVRFLAALGVMGGLLFALVIVAQWFAIVLLDPCPP